MIKEFNVIIERDAEGFFVASVPALRGCHTQAKSYDELLERVKEAIQLCIEIEDSSVETPDFVGIQRIAIEI